MQMPRMPLRRAAAQRHRFRARLKLARVHWAVEVTYVTWTEDNLLRQVSYQGQREDKPARQVVRLVPHPSRRWFRTSALFDSFILATEPNSPEARCAGAGFPHLRRTCLGRQSLEGFTGGAGASGTVAAGWERDGLPRFGR
jgi:hypothetical protein